MKTASPTLESPEESDALAVDIGATLLGTVSRVLNGWAMVFAIAALLILGLRPLSLVANAGLASSLAVALLQAYFAARCAFDAALFAQLGGAAQQYARFDQVMARWTAARKNVAARTIDERLHGAMQLLKKQGYCLAAQIALFSVALIIQASAA